MPIVIEIERDRDRNEEHALLDGLRSGLLDSDDDEMDKALRHGWTIILKRLSRGYARQRVLDRQIKQMHEWEARQQEIESIRAKIKIIDPDDY